MKASGTAGWASLSAWEGDQAMENVGSSPISHPVLRCDGLGLLGAGPTCRMTPGSGQLGSGSLGREGKVISNTVRDGSVILFPIIFSKFLMFL